MSKSKLINSKPSISAVIVVYNDYHSLNLLIESLSDQVDTIFVIDNSDVESVLPKQILTYSNVIYHRMGCNEGLGAGLNVGINLSKNNKSDWVLLLDQDSVVSDNMTGCMLDEYHRISEQKNIGMICPDVFLTDKNYHLFPMSFGRFLTKKITATSGAADFSITSGSMVKLSLFEIIGFMDERFFIDYIDYDFCLRLRAEDYKILYVREAILNHRLGERKTSDIGIKYTAHAPVRVYYQTRNRLIVMQRYGVRFPSFALMQASLFALKLFKIIVVEDQKISRLQYYFKGIFDFISKQYSLT